MEHSSDLIIFSKNQQWAEELQNWALALSTIRNCLIEPWPETEPTQWTTEPDTLICLDCRDEEANRVRQWSQPTLERLNCILVIPKVKRCDWQDLLTRYDWDAVDEPECTQGFFSYILTARLRLIEAQEQINEISGRFDTAGHVMAEQWLNERSSVSDLRRSTEFLANMSHEIRTPLNTIVGMSDMLLDAHIHGVEKKHLEVIKKSSHTLLALMENILDLSHLETGRLTFESSLFDVHDLIERTFDLVTPRAHKKGLETTLEIDRSVPAFVSTDKNRLHQILVNLLSNAVKFTEKGAIYLHANFHHHEGQPRLQIHVHDTGFGLSTEQVARTFEDSHHNAACLIRAQDGPGLGLLLARKFVDGLGGELSIQTNQSQGSIFSFYIPVEVPAAQLIDVQMREELAPLKGRRIIILDHHADSSRVTAEYLRQLDFEVETAKEPAEFLSHILHFQVNYDLALIDYETAGPQLSTWLSQAVALPKDLRVAIMLKSNTHAWSRIPRRKSALGIHHLMKPIKRGELLILLKNVFKELYPGPSEDESIELLPRARPDENFRILIVDDSKDNRYLMQAYLRDSYRATWFAENGRMAVEMVRARRFNLIFMDLQMPEMDGITATQMIRLIERQNRWPHTPIFALTGHVLSEEKNRALQAGCDDYIVKPVVRKVILDSIRKARERNWAAPELQQKSFDLK